MYGLMSSYDEKFEISKLIGATTVGTGGDWSPSFRVHRSFDTQYKNDL